jgi:soluble epoxide hydrolase / lipid-phosphate phosphatase
MSLPYTPPSPVYIPVQEMATRAPNLGYQVYLNDARSTAEIEANVCFLQLLELHTLTKAA